ncbi:hypothetical protein DFJ74DRAFT_636082 [Hyaloraphidium curvatum]|nr:hypothetical protein DFJ74DRAFT_636082 [Hyaloraphidium curvatum]
MMTGQSLPRGAKPFAMRYGGTQFGHYAGQLGDGRVVTLGELEVPELGGKVELQIKGAGVTPFSRRGDGYASLRGCVREWLFSEVLHALGIPVARTLSIYLTGRQVQRDRGPEPGAILSRAAPSFVRFGTFELLAAENQLEALKALADYVAERHFRPCLDDVAGWAKGTNKYGRILLDVAERNAAMVAAWQAYGFCHGTINTDNLSVLGLTMDLSGPSAFMDAFDPNWTPNLSDPGGLYAFDQQPDAVREGIRTLARSLAHLVADRTGADPVERTAAHFDACFRRRYLELMRARLGLAREREGDGELTDSLVGLLAEAKADAHVFFRQLCKWRAYIPPIRGSNLPEVPDFPGMLAKWHAERGGRRGGPGEDAEGVRKRASEWFERYTARVFRESEAWDSLIELDRKRQARMRAANPRLVPRGWIADEIAREVEAWAAAGDAEDGVEGLGGAMGRLEAITVHLRAGRRESEGCAALGRAVRVLVGDLWGGLSEELGNGGLRDGEERDRARRWAREPEGKRANMLCTCSS